MIRRRKRVVTTREYIVIAGLSVTLVILVFGVFDIFLKEEQARKTADQTKSELQTLHERTDKLQKDMAEVTSERGKEAALRQMYGVARPGEEVLIVMNPPEEGKSFLSWWRRFLSWFGL